MKAGDTKHKIAMRKKEEAIQFLMRMNAGYFTHYDAKCFDALAESAHIAAEHRDTVIAKLGKKGDA